MLLKHNSCEKSWLISAIKNETYKLKIKINSCLLVSKFLRSSSEEETHSAAGTQLLITLSLLQRKSTKIVPLEPVRNYFSRNCYSFFNTIKGRKGLKIKIECLIKSFMDNM